MPTAGLVEHFMRRTGAAMRRCIEKQLIRFRILDDRFRFAPNGEDDGPVGPFELLHELARVCAGKW